MDRRELLAAGMAALLPTSALALAPARSRTWHPDEPYNVDSLAHAHVLQAAVAEDEFPRDQWEALRAWIGAEPEAAFQGWVGLIGSDEPLRRSYMTLKQAAEVEHSETMWLIGSRGPVLYRVSGIYELQLLRRAIERTYLPRVGRIEWAMGKFVSSPGEPDANGHPTVWIRTRIDYDLYLDPELPAGIDVELAVGAGRTGRAERGGRT